MSFDVAKLADHQLVDPDGELHRFGDRWSEQRALVLFLRHFG
jgi:hypothetical protein